MQRWENYTFKTEVCNKMLLLLLLLLFSSSSSSSSSITKYEFAYPRNHNH